MDDQTTNNELYCMFGEMLGQDIPFMRQWVRCFVLTHKKFVGKLTGDYLKECKDNTVVKGCESGSRADILTLYIFRA